MSSGIPKTNDCPLNRPPVVATGPALSVKFAGVGETDEISTKKLIDTLEDFFDYNTFTIKWW